jgi:predicted phage tail protein
MTEWLKASLVIGIFCMMICVGVSFILKGEYQAIAPTLMYGATALFLVLLVLD